MLHALRNIQVMAYHRACDRSDANIMPFYPKTLTFAFLYTKLFMDIVNYSASNWKVFGVPYHSVYNNNNIIISTLLAASTPMEPMRPSLQ